VFDYKPDLLITPWLNRERSAAYLAHLNCAGRAESLNFRLQFLKELDRLEESIGSTTTRDGDRFEEALLTLVHNWGLVPPMDHEALIAAFSEPKNVYDPSLSPDRKPEIVIPRYVRNWSAPYRRLVERFANLVGPLESGTELSIHIPVAGAQEQGTIGRTLECIKRIDLPPERFRVVLLVNIPAGAALTELARLRDCLTTISRFCDSNPELRIRWVSAEIDRGLLRIGMLRSMLDDVAVFQLAAGEGTHRHHTVYDLIIARWDADTRGVDQSYARRILDFFKANTDTDLLAARSVWSFERLAADPLFFANQLFDELLMMAIRVYARHPPKGGPGAAYRASAYAAVGGYRFSWDLCEDVQFSELIAKSAGAGRNAVRSLGFGMKYLTDTRRAETAFYEAGAPSLDQWCAATKFGVDNEKIRMRSATPMLAGALVTDRDFPEQLQRVIRRTLQSFLSSGLQKLMTPKVIARALGFLGVDADLSDIRNPQVINYDRFIKRWDRFLADGQHEWRNRHFDERSGTDPNKPGQPSSGVEL
jgi:hypothetical protein